MQREKNKFYSSKNEIDSDEPAPEIKGPPRR